MKTLKLIPDETNIDFVGKRFLAFGLSLLVACTSASVHLVSNPGPQSLDYGNGGVLGAALGEWMRASVSGLGTVLVLGY